MSNATQAAPALPLMDETYYRSRRRRQGLREDLNSFWFLLPILALFVILFLVPLVQTAYYSFTDFNGYSTNMKFVGFDNYKKVFSDPSTLSGLGFTILYAIVVMIGVTALAIPLAVVLNRKFVDCNFVRSVFFFFSVPSLAIMGMVWKYIFSPMKTGVVNSILTSLGFDPIPWLSNNSWAKFCVIFIAIWAQIGWHATLYLAFLQAIPADLYEQATVDGASKFQQFIHITLPQLTPRHRHLHLPADVRRPQGLRPALHDDQGRSRLFDLHRHPVHHPTRHRPIPIRHRIRPSRTLLHRHRHRGVPTDERFQPDFKEVPVMSATTKHPTKAKGMNFTTRKRISSAITSIVMIAIALICAIPLWYIVINTFKTIPDMSSNPLGLPKQWTFDNYTHAFATVPILRSLWNTLIVTFFGVAIQVIVGALAAYGMILRKSRFTAIIGTILMVAFVVPAQSTLIPLYRMEAQTHIVNTLGGLVLIYLGGCVFCYFLIVGYMRSLPFELIEAARIDGAGPLRIFWSIVMPLIRPILTTVVVFQTMSTWNDFMNANVFISSSNLRTIVLQVYNAVGQFSTDWPSFMTITVLALLPVFVFFIFCQKWIVSGLVAGSVKG